MSGVELSTSEHDGLTVAVLRGELDVTDAAAVATELGMIASSGRVIIADLTGLEFIDSSGLAALAHVRRHARRRGGDMLLVAPQQWIRRILALTGRTDFFSFHAALDEASAAARAALAAAPVLIQPGSTGQQEPQAMPAA
jgi:anti-sigma B factor antagonist